MALVHADFVRETTTTTGTGTLSLAGATTGCRTFIDAIGNNNTCYYAIETSAGLFESGIGTVASGTPSTLARTTLIASSTGSKLDLPAGIHIVYCTFSAAATSNFLSASQIWTGEEPPTDPAATPLWWDSTDGESEAGTLYVRYGTTWVAAAASMSASASVDNNPALIAAQMASSIALGAR